MIRGRCPTCSKPYEIQKIDDLPGFPFCSERCRLIDLGRWADGTFAIPVTPKTNPDGDNTPPEEESEEE